MSERAKEAEQQHMLHVVESAQRAGLSETEIAEIVEDAIEADAEVERAA
jgi:DNA-binding transcriptional regulator YhcF (GntR family)